MPAFARVQTPDFSGDSQSPPADFVFQRRLAWFRDAIFRDPENADLWIAVAEFCRQYQRTRQAVQAYATAIQLLAVADRIDEARSVACMLARMNPVEDPQRRTVG